MLLRAQSGAPWLLTLGQRLARPWKCGCTRRHWYLFEAPISLVIAFSDEHDHTTNSSTCNQMFCPRRVSVSMCPGCNVPHTCPHFLVVGTVNVVSEPLELITVVRPSMSATTLCINYLVQARH